MAIFIWHIDMYLQNATHAEVLHYMVGTQGLWTPVILTLQGLPLLFDI